MARRAHSSRRTAGARRNRRRRSRVRAEAPRRRLDGRDRRASGEDAMTPWWARTEVAGPWFDVGTDRVRLLRDGVEAFPAMLAAIAEAKKEIILEMYWVGADAVGTKFREALAKR